MFLKKKKRFNKQILYVKWTTCSSLLHSTLTPVALNCSYPDLLAAEGRSGPRLSMLRAGEGTLVSLELTAVLSKPASLANFTCMVTHTSWCQNPFLITNTSTDEVKEFDLLPPYGFLPQTPKCCLEGLGPGRLVIHTPEPGESRGDAGLLYAYSACPLPSPDTHEVLINTQPTL